MQLVATDIDLLGDLDELLAEDVISARRREASTFDAVAGDRADRIVLFGAGGLGRRTLAGLRADGIEPVAFADNRAELWDTTIDGVPVPPPGAAAERHASSATFVVTIWGANKPHRL